MGKYDRREIAIPRRLAALKLMTSGLARDSPKYRGAQNERQDHAENEDPEQNLRNSGKPGGNSAKSEYPEYHGKCSTDNRPLQHSE